MLGLIFRKVTEEAWGMDPFPARALRILKFPTRAVPRRHRPAGPLPWLPVPAPKTEAYETPALSTLVRAARTE